MTPPKVAQLELFAGAVGGSGNADGIGATARFYGPQGIASDRNGNLYVVDASNHTIRKIDPARRVTTFAGSPGLSGNVDGAGSAARFNSPKGIATDSAGNVYVADSDNNNLRKITPAGAVTTLAAPIWKLSRLTNIGSFNNLPGVAVDAAGNVFVADQNDFTVVKVAPGGQVTVLAGTTGVQGFRDGPGSDALFSQVGGVAVGLNGEVFVGDRNRIRRVAPDGTVTTFAGGESAGIADGPAASATLHTTAAVATDLAGSLYVLELATFGPPTDIRKITADGVVSTLTNQLGSTVNAITVGVDGVLYATDGQGNVVEAIDTSGHIGVIAGANLPAGNVDGPASTARFREITAAATDGLGNVYVADRGNRNVRKITPAGDVTTLLTMANETMTPVSVATDTAGNAFVGWFDCSQLDPTRIYCLAGVTRVNSAGVASSVSVQGGGTVPFFYPGGLAVDGSGAIYVADGENKAVKRIAPSGNITIVAAVAPLNSVAVDRSGNVYAISDSAVFKVNDGSATLLAGATGSGLVSGNVDGAGAVARFGNLRAIAVDEAGDIYVADAGNDSVRKVTSAGLVTTIAGTPRVQGFTPGPLPGVLDTPRGIAIGGTNLYIAMTTGVAVIRNRNN